MHCVSAPNTASRTRSINVKFENYQQKTKVMNCAHGQGQLLFKDLKDLSSSQLYHTYSEECLLQWKRNYRPLASSVQCIFAMFSVEYIGSKMRFHSPSDVQDSLNSLEVNSEESPLHELGEMLDRLITREKQGRLSHSLGLHLANQRLLSHNTDSEMFKISTRVHLQNLPFIMSICKY